MSYELIVTQIKNGGLPVVTGLHFTRSQADEIKSILESRKKSYVETIDKYFEMCIDAKVLKDQSMSGKREAL